MAQVEPYLVELIDQLAKMRAPVSTKQGLELANSLINGTSTQEDVLRWKQKIATAFGKTGKLNSVKAIGKDSKRETNTK
jgi:hypothetical protein